MDVHFGPCHYAQNLLPFTMKSTKVENLACLVNITEDRYEVNYYMYMYIQLYMRTETLIQCRETFCESHKKTEVKIQYQKPPIKLEVIIDLYA